MTQQELAQALLDWVNVDTENRSVVAILSTDKDPTGDNEHNTSSLMVGGMMLNIRGLTSAMVGDDGVRAQFEIALKLAEKAIQKKPDIAKEIVKTPKTEF